MAAPPSSMPPGGGETTATGGGMGQGLPEGHPPIDPSAIIRQLSDLAAQNPKDPEVRLKLANFLYDQKQYEKAIPWYQQALELDPKNVNARTDLGTAFYYTGRPQDALREYDQSLKINSSHEQTLLNIIVVSLNGTHDVAGAQKAWNRLNQLNPNHPALAGLKEQIDAARKAGGGSK